MHQYIIKESMIFTHRDTDFKPALVSIHQYIIYESIIFTQRHGFQASARIPIPIPNSKSEIRNPLPTPSQTSFAHAFKAHHTRIHRTKLEMAFFIIDLLGVEAAAGQQPADYAPFFTLANWLYAYCTLSPRFAKMAVGLDHNVSPREDISKYGDAAVQAGKLSQRRLEQIRRMQSAHENSVEGFTLFVACGTSYSGSSVLVNCSVG